MKLENQVCSLELAQKLKELGFEQESLFYLVEIEYKHFQLLFFEEGWQYKKEDWKDCEGGEPKHYPAYTSAELGEILGKYKSVIQTWAVGNNNDCFRCGVVGFGKESPVIDAETEADARAKLLICLKENNLI